MAEKLDSERLRPLSPNEARLSDIADTWFPEAYASGSFDFSRLYQIAESEGDRAPPFFGLAWPRKSEAISLLNVPANGALLRDNKLSSATAASSHVFCIGDNLEVMKLMQPAYFGKFKMAYVDPPYNTAGDFVFDDSAADSVGAYLKVADEGETYAAPSGNTHARWLSMMLPRLFLIRNLLRDDGVVFVVIDDHESHRLRMLMDEVFGEENFVCTFIWEKKYAPAPDAPDVGYVHENILCYRKSDSFTGALLPMTAAQTGRYKNPDNDRRGPWKPADYTCRYTSEERPTLYYAVTNPNTGKKVWPKKTRVWACSEDSHEKNVRENLIWWPPDAEVPAKKKFIDRIAQGAKPRSLLAKEVVGHTDEATKELRDVMPDLKLTPKPTRLITHLIAIAGLTGDDLLLDPYAGIGTVIAAVATATNAKPRVVSIELPEKIDSTEYGTLAEAGIARITRIMKLGDKPNQGLKVFRLKRTGIKRWDLRSDATLGALTSSMSLALDTVDSKRSDSELLSEIALQAGVELTDIPEASSDQAKIFSFKGADVSIVLSSIIREEDLSKLVASDTSRVILLDSALGKDESFRIHVVSALAEADKRLQLV